MLSIPTIRERVLVEFDRMRAEIVPLLQPGTGNRFRWLESDLWLDRSRYLIVELTKAEELGFADKERVPDGLEEEVEYRGCRYCSRGSWDVVQFLRTLVLGRGPELRSGGECAILLNYAVMQPLVNPAFGPLFWIGLHVDLDNRRAAEPDLGLALGAMAYDLARYPASKNEAGDVREAQLQYVKTYVEPDLDDGKWRRASDQDWAAHCQELWYVDKSHNLFALVENAIQRDS